MGAPSWPFMPCGVDHLSVCRVCRCGRRSWHGAKWKSSGVDFTHSSCISFPHESLAIVMFTIQFFRYSKHQTIMLCFEVVRMPKPGHKPGQRLVGERVNKKQLRKILGVTVFFIRDNKVIIVPGILSLELRTKFNDLGLSHINHIKSGPNEGLLVWYADGRTISRWHSYLDTWIAEQVKENCR